MLYKYVDSISKVNQRLYNKGPAEGWREYIKQKVTVKNGTVCSFGEKSNFGSRTGWCWQEKYNFSFFLPFCWKCLSYKLKNSTLLFRNWAIFIRNTILCNIPRSDAGIGEERYKLTIFGCWKENTLEILCLQLLFLDHNGRTAAKEELLVYSAKPTTSQF